MKEETRKLLIKAERAIRAAGESWETTKWKEL